MRHILFASLLALATLFALAGSVAAADTQVVSLSELRHLPANSSWTSAPVDLASAEGYFSIGMESWGGAVDVAFETSLDGALWMPGDVILDDFSGASGPGANGKISEPFSPDFARYVRFKVTAASADADFLLKLAYR